MAHESYEILEQRLADTESVVALGSLWRHYKGGIYRVDDYAIFEANDEPGIKYSPVDRPGVRLFRLLSSWQETVRVDDQMVPRFELVEPVPEFDPL